MNRISGWYFIYYWFCLKFCYPWRLRAASKHDSDVDSDDDERATD